MATAPLEDRLLDLLIQWEYSMISSFHTAIAVNGTKTPITKS
jgi:hypothetical protein